MPEGRGSFPPGLPADLILIGEDGTVKHEKSETADYSSCTFSKEGAGGSGKEGVKQWRQFETDIVYEDNDSKRVV